MSVAHFVDFKQTGRAKEVAIVITVRFYFPKWLFARLPQIKCIRYGSVRSSHLQLKLH